MRGATAAAYLGAAPPVDLTFAWWCEEYQTMPTEGGMYAQDWVLLSRMSNLKRIYRLRSKVMNLKGKQIHTLNSSERRLIKWLRDEGVWDG